MLELEEYIYETFHSDGAGLSTTLRGMAEAMGSTIKYFDHNIAQLEKPALASLDEVDKAKLVDTYVIGLKTLFFLNPEKDTNKNIHL